MSEVVSASQSPSPLLGIKLIAGYLFLCGILDIAMLVAAFIIIFFGLPNVLEILCPFLAVGSLAVASGLIGMQNWARISSIVLLFLHSFFAFYFFVFATTIGYTACPVILLNLIMIYYLLFNTSVKKLFREMSYHG
jgi:hypothetical protein